MDCVVNPPMPGEPSYEQFTKEKKAVLDSLNLRAKMVADTFNSIEGISCNPVQVSYSANRGEFWTLVIFFVQFFPLSI